MYITNEVRYCMIETGNQTQSLQKLLTVKDVQSILNIGRTTAYQLMRSSGFPTLRINNRLFVSQEALEKWIKMYSGRQYLI